MANWPASLPQQFEQDGYREEDVDHTLRNQPDGGPPLSRPKFTGKQRMLRGTMIMDATQVGTFKTFYYTTTNRGADYFTMTDVYGDSSDFKFYSKYDIQSIGDEFRVQMTLLEKPSSA